MDWNAFAQLPELLDKGLLLCVECRQVVEQPLLLRCLHNCCSVCADSAAAAVPGSTKLLCSVCDVYTDIGIMKQHDRFTRELAISFKALRDVNNCTMCTEDGKPDELAEAWCRQCQRSLCCDCMKGHSQYNRSHTTIAIDEITSFTDVLHAEGRLCSVHGKQLELLCFDCKLAKCTDCVRQCESLGHTALQPIDGPQAKVLLEEARASIKQHLMFLHGKSQELLPPQNLVSRIRSARGIHLDELRTKKKLALDTLSKSFDEAREKLEEIYDGLQESAEKLQLLAEQLEQSLQHALKYVGSLSDIADASLLLEQQMTLTTRLEALSMQVDGFKAIPDVGVLVTLNGSLPEDLNKVLVTIIGAPKLTADLEHAVAEVWTLKDEAESNINTAQRLQQHFGPASSSFQLGFDCCDLSVTPEGHLLLAGGKRGMRAYDMDGNELSSWRPPVQSDGENDFVTTVAALDDGRAAVGVLRSQHVTLLQPRSNGRGWLVERHVARLQLPPWQMSVHGDLVAVALSGLPGLLMHGRQLQLLRLSTGQSLCGEAREYKYDILSVALTAVDVITTSWGRKRPSDGIEVDVVECYSHHGELLWSRPLRYREYVAGVCTSPTGQLYMAVCVWNDASKDCVRVMDMAERNKVKDVLVTSSHDVNLPMRLALSRRQQQLLVLAVLSRLGHVTVNDVIN